MENLYKRYESVLDSKTRNKNKKKIGNNTYLYRYENNDIAIRLHETDIITLKPNGSIILDSDGWKTVTTKARLNEFLPYRIEQKSGIWYITVNGTVYVFADKMTISARGKVKGAMNKQKTKKALNIQKKIKAYVMGYIEALKAGKIAKPSGGDCWFCALRTEDNKSMGDNFKDTSHLDEHFKEKYYVPSLLVNAVEQYPVSIIAKSRIGELLGYSENQLGENFNDIIDSQVKSSLTRYLKKQFGIGS